MSEEATNVKRAIPGFSGLFALDDYGSGYHSENALLRLRPQFIKLDMSIVRSIHLSPDRQMIVSHTIEYAHASDMRVIAEGVETASELTVLVELGVDFLQGYCLARPAEAPAPLDEESLRIIHEHAASSEA